MGEWMEQIPVKLPRETVERLDLLRGSYPFKPGRSTVIRELVEEGLRLIAEGIMQFRATTSNRVPSVQSIPGTPSQVSAAFPSIGQEKKPLTRATHRRVAREGQAIHGVNRMGVEVVEAWVPHFPGKVSPINSTPYAEVA